MAGGHIEAGPGMLQYTNEPAVEHIAWEETDDGILLTLLPKPIRPWAFAFQISCLFAVLAWLVLPGIREPIRLPFSLVFLALSIDQVLRFRRSRKPIYIRVSTSEHRLKITGAGLLSPHNWIVAQIHEIRAPITGFTWSGQVKSAIEISPVHGSRIQIGVGRRMEEMDWAVKKLRRAMVIAGWEGAYRKSRARRLGEWIGRSLRGSPATPPGAAQ